MHRTLTTALAAAALLLGTACVDAEDDAALETTPAAAPEQMAAPAQPMTSAPATPVALAVDSLQGMGAYLTNAEGRALYLLEGEPQGQSTCYDACAEEWPPLLVQQGESPGTAATAALQPGLLGTLQRRDGTTQVTYNGQALYFYHGDQGPGQAQGQDVTDQWGEWYLVQPSGEPLHDAGSK